MDVEVGNQVNNQSSLIDRQLVCRFRPETRRRLRNIINAVYPWFLCTLSFIVQFLVLGFFKGFGSVYIALQAEFKESDALTGKKEKLIFLTFGCYIIIQKIGSVRVFYAIKNLNPTKNYLTEIFNIGALIIPWCFPIPTNRNKKLLTHGALLCFNIWAANSKW